MAIEENIEKYEHIMELFDRIDQDQARTGGMAQFNRDKFEKLMPPERAQAYLAPVCMPPELGDVRLAVKTPTVASLWKCQKKFFLNKSTRLSAR